MPLNKPAAIARWCEVGDNRKAEYKKKWAAEKAKYGKAMTKYDNAMAKYELNKDMAKYRAQQN